jgi:hypothetical protein
MQALTIKASAEQETEVLIEASLVMLENAGCEVYEAFSVCKHEWDILTPFGWVGVNSVAELHSVALNVSKQ